MPDQRSLLLQLSAGAVAKHPERAILAARRQQLKKRPVRPWRSCQRPHRAALQLQRRPDRREGVGALVPLPPLHRPCPRPRRSTARQRTCR